jgi:hypothetical protein
MGSIIPCEDVLLAFLVKMQKAMDILVKNEIWGFHLWTWTSGLKPELKCRKYTCKTNRAYSTRAGRKHVHIKVHQHEKFGI